LDKNKKQKILLLALVGVGVFVWLQAFQSPPAVEDTADDQEMEEPIAVDEEQLLTIALASSTNLQRPRTVYQDWGKNPFFIEVPPVKEEPAPLLLQGISWDEKNPIAVLNGQVVGIGDSLGGHTVKDIQRDKILLNDGNKDMELHLR
jgi:hypothetical protein